MKIFVGNALLLDNEVIEENKLQEELERRKGEGWELQRKIYLWDKVGLVCSRNSDKSVDLEKTIRVELLEYDLNSFSTDFPGRAILAPDKVIFVNGYDYGIGHICHHISSVIRACKVLERNGVYCLVNPNRFPLLENIEYCSPKIKNWLRIDIKRIYL